MDNLAANTGYGCRIYHDTYHDLRGILPDGPSSGRNHETVIFHSLYHLSGYLPALVVIPKSPGYPSGDRDKETGLQIERDYQHPARHIFPVLCIYAVWIVRRSTYSSFPDKRAHFMGAVLPLRLAADTV